MATATPSSEKSERQRISELLEFNILDSPAEDSYDDIVALAKTLAGTPAAYITFIDTNRLWFKSIQGLPGPDLPRESSFCQFVVESEEYVLVEDAWNDSRFLIQPDGTVIRRTEDNANCTAAPEVSRIRFYLGVPLRSTTGNVLGTLCVSDFEPRTVDDEVVGALRRLAGQVTALLELRRANAALAAERETFSTLFDAAPVPLLLVSEGLIRRGNHAFSRLAGLGVYSDSDEAVDAPVDRYVEAIPEQPGEVLESVLRNDHGEEFPVDVYRTHLTLHRRSFDLLAVNDITDRKEKERILREKRTRAENAARIKDTFLSLVSHDLKSPLSGIYAMLDLLATAGDSFSEDDRNEAIRDLRSTAALLMEMINQLLNIHRLESGTLRLERHVVEIEPIAQDVLLSLNRQIADKDLKSEVAIDPEFRLSIDEALFREALFNLVSNAVKFSPPGAMVRIEADNGEAGTVEAGAVSGSGGEVRVIDQGSGVPPEDIPDLFRQDVKTSRIGTAGEGGTGLGLPLVNDIMRAHGGEVQIRYTGTDGSCFVLKLPVA